MYIEQPVCCVVSTPGKSGNRVSAMLYVRAWAGACVCVCVRCVHAFSTAVCIEQTTTWDPCMCVCVLRYKGMVQCVCVSVFMVHVCVLLCGIYFRLVSMKMFV